jgi:hypothetical protein
MVRGFREMRRQVFLSVAFAASMAVAPAVHAELVVNPGFEADGASGSSLVPSPTGWTALGNAGADTTNPNTGNYDGFIATGSLSQVIVTVPGTVYTVSFYADVNDSTLAYVDTGATLDAMFDGIDLIGGPIAASTLFDTAGYDVQFTTQVTAVDASATLEFDGVTTPSLQEGTFYIDDISVTPAPEPASIVLLAPALVGLLLARRRSAPAAA